MHDDLSKGSKILIVDDHLHMRRHIRQALEEGGYRVTEAESGIQAIKMVMDSPPDLVLLDVVMADMDGFATCAGLRRLPTGRHFPILMITTLEDPQTIDQAYAVGATDYIQKPINPPYLRHHVGYLLRAHRISEELRRKEHRLAQAQRIAKIGDWEWDRETEGFRFSEEALKIFGLPPGNPFVPFPILLGQVHPEDRDHVQKSLTRIVRESGCARFDFRLALPNVISMINGQGEPVRDWSDKESSHAGIFQDITDMHAVQERLLLSAKVFENSSEMIIIAGSKADIIDVNPSLCHLTGYSRQELIGRRLEEKIFADPHIVRQLWKIMVQTGHWQGEILYRRRSGETFPALVTIDTASHNRGRSMQYVLTATDLSRLKDAEQRLQHLSHHDPLTDLPNRLLFHDRFRQALDAAARNDNVAGLIVFDIDNFKEINDSIGHIGGDEVLRTLAKRVKTCMRKRDTVARLGSDEFAIILSDLRPNENGALVAERVLETLKMLFSVGGKEFFLNISAGLAFFPEDGTDVEVLISKAGAAMKFAKRQGGNHCQFFSAAMNLRAKERLEMKTALRQGIARQEFFLHYQPKFCTETCRLTGVEALARWAHPRLGLLSPPRFIPLAEESGLILPLGEQILRLACSQNLGWQQKGLEAFRIAVNLSAYQFRDESLVERVNEILAETGLSPEWLELEITESAIMEDMDLSFSILRRFREMGIRIALDDFGTGYSSLNHLRKFPVDTLKIDHSFIRNLFVKSEDTVIVKAIISLARNLNLRSIAEGVETEEQRIFLLEQGCDEIQGYVAKMPMPKREIEQFLRKSSPVRKISAVNIIQRRQEL